MSDTFIQDRCAIFLADLPRSIDGDKISRLHMAYGLPLPVDFQLLHDSTETQASCAAIFRYTDPTTTDGALEVFSGLPVEYNGRYWPLRAKLAGMKIPDRGPIQPKEMPKAPPVDDPIVLVREVPADWSQKDLMSFHLSLGMEEFQTARMMPSSDGGLTRHAYLQYRTAAAASNAVSSLSGSLVHPRSGEPRRLIAGLASDVRHGAHGQNGIRGRQQGPGKTSGYRNQARDRDSDHFEAGPQQDPYTLYLSDMPSDFNKKDLERLHDQLGIIKPKVIKVLYLRLNKSKSSAVLRYDTMEQAKSALMVLQDRLVLVNEHSGEEQHPRAQFARKRSPQLAFAQDDNSYGGSDHEDREEDDTIYALPSVYVAELPINITENGVRHMVQEVGGKLDDLVAVTFLQQKFKGSHACCLLRYQDMETAESMAEKLHGFRVYHPDDRTRPVRAKVAKHSKALNYMCTDVYVGEVPNNWTASYMYKFLTQAGVERNVIHSVKLLSQRPGRVGVGAILHIVSAEAADRVLEQLTGQEILVRGKPRPLKVRLADAPKEPWMEPEQPEPPQPPAPEIRKPAITAPVPLSQLQ
ncbi:unnamed protein product [Cladocopium goreaui]|uniref:RRM domain-containing protein n=1 Tax=Cladocopium goreaui TaxID=2562237 RepID=A0A9P1BRT1_9DINO|nr:unnamed protein product [Cladocopium goreaui]|mmetsp:Transcript_18039/g.39727  ORF Transcript_18039/g.39727 Transcript_18039/m.39727 type:complete len:580 (+) Transcript_18039:31-1770(+)